jgi:hypothetical protein
MKFSPKVRMNRLFRNGGCLDVAVDHGVCNEPSFLNGLEDMPRVIEMLVGARPDAIQMTFGQADLLQSRPEYDKPALVMRLDMGNPSNATRNRVIRALSVPAVAIIATNNNPTFRHNTASTIHPGIASGGDGSTSEIDAVLKITTCTTARNTSINAACFASVRCASVCPTPRSAITEDHSSAAVTSPTSATLACATSSQM